MRESADNCVGNIILIAFEADARKPLLENETRPVVVETARIARALDIILEYNTPIMLPYISVIRTRS